MVRTDLTEERENGHCIWTTTSLDTHMSGATPSHSKSQRPGVYFQIDIPTTPCRRYLGGRHHLFLTFLCYSAWLSLAGVLPAKSFPAVETPQTRAPNMAEYM